MLLAYSHEAMSEVWVLFDNLYHLIHFDVSSVDKDYSLAARTHVVR